MNEDNTSEGEGLDRFSNLTFYKLCASGNDFIVILNFERKIQGSEAKFLAQKLCRPKFSISADGLILLEPPFSSEANFSWKFFNADGSEAEMCGNGARCVARLVTELGLFKSPLCFETKAGLIWAEVKNSRVKVNLTSPKDLKLNLEIKTNFDKYTAHFVNTGVPHVVIFLDEENLKNLSLEKIAPEIRFHESFKPSGTNVNFVALSRKNLIKIRTYERGVEAETLACGTGASASAYITYKLGLTKHSEIDVLTKSGEILKVYINERENKLYLEGDTSFILEGKIKKDALK
ncbi:MAG: diaminopimelate epimerase [Thermodesulfobacteriaceae bacterium]|nr:diaminopimelate epimerase [Thermodesulfobacteriaceae bacterium]MCX8042219.1 diaminopimelate epimerase [Thermodesulfobacteriaceae bacterium]MDW8136619.1 diaminopimelate epimerase [Thermodesulfobacterium sp.]